MSDKAVLRAKLTAFYQKYAPNDVSKVDLAMQIKKPENELWTFLYDKYKAPKAEADALLEQAAASVGASASPAVSSPSVPEDKRLLKAKLEAFYKKYAPADMAKIDVALRIERPEAELWKYLYEKYKVNKKDAEKLLASVRLESNDVPAAAPSAGVEANKAERDAKMLKQLTAFYTAFAPQDKNRIDTAMRIEKPPQEIFDYLFKKYNVDPAVGQKVVDDAVASDKSAMRTKLVAFYTRYAPQDIHKVEVALGLAQPESEVWGYLFKKYGVDKTDGEAVLAAAALPVIQVSRPLSTMEKDALKRELTSFYQKYAPDEVSKAESGSEVESHEVGTLWDLLYKRYKVDPKEADAVRAASVDEELLRAQLDAFYDKYKEGKRQTDKAMGIVAAGTTVPKLWSHLFEKSNISLADGEAFLAAVKDKRDREKREADAAVAQAAEAERAKQRADLAADEEAERGPLAAAETSEFDVLVAKHKEAVSDIKLRDDKRAQEEAAQRQKAEAESAAAQAALAEQAAAKAIAEKEAAAKAHEVKPPPKGTTTIKAPMPAAKPAPKSGKVTPVGSRSTTPTKASSVAKAIPTKTAPAPPLPRQQERRASLHPPEATSEAQQLHVNHHDHVEHTEVAEEEHETHEASEHDTLVDRPAVISDPPGPCENCAQLEARLRIAEKNLDLKMRQAAASASGDVATLMAEISRLEDRVLSSDRRVASLAAREVTLDERERAMDVREAAVAAQLAMVRAGASHVAAHHHHIDKSAWEEGYFAQLVQMEASLHEAQVELSALAVETQRRAQTVRKLEQQALHAQAAAEDTERRLRARADAIEREFFERTAEHNAAAEMSRKELHRLTELERSLNEKQRDLVAREAKVITHASELAAREAKIANQTENIAKEKDLCKKLSDELLRREGAVRAAEKGINSARAQLKALEDEVATRVRRVGEDQTALKRWAEELERRDAELAAAQKRLRATITAVNGDPAQLLGPSPR